MPHRHPLSRASAGRPVGVGGRSPSGPGGRRALTAGGLAAAGAAFALDARRIRRAVRDDPAGAALASPVPARVRRVSTRDGIGLNVAVTGPEEAEGPTIVLVHGWTCAMRFWRLQARTFAASHRVVAYDLRGHGRSDPPGRDGFTTDSLGEDLQAVLDATVPRGERAILVGHSLGAMSIVAWAGGHPDQVPRRALAAGLLNTGLGDLVSESLLVPVPSRIRRLSAAGGALMLGAPGPMPRVGGLTHRAVHYAALGPGATPAQVDFCERLVVDCDPTVRAGHGRMLSRLDLQEAADALTVPTLVLAGTRDRLTPVVHAERLARALPDPADLVRVPGSGHMSPIEHPEAVDAAIGSLLDVAGTNERPPTPAAAGVTD